MKLYFPKTPKFVTWLLPKRIWAFSHLSAEQAGSNKIVYLTFDDGPIPEVTPWVLKKLKQYNAKATFFCIGKNINRHPAILKKILDEGHTIGNHTQNHLNGSKTELKKYMKDVEDCETTLNNQPSYIVNQKSKPLFRPPYGKLTQKQAKTLQNRGFTIVMWDVLSYDWDASVSEEKCLQNILKNIHAGSIVVFHDSLKAEKNMKYSLPKVLEFIKEKGWEAKELSEKTVKSYS